jgi:toxin YoeB
MLKIWTDEAWEEYLYWQTQDRKTLKRINKLISSIDRNGYNCIGNPEPLTGKLQVIGVLELTRKTVLFFA